MYIYIYTNSMVWVCPEMGRTMDVLQNDHLEGEHDTQP